MDLTDKKSISVKTVYSSLLIVISLISVFAATDFSESSTSSSTVLPSTSQRNLVTDKGNQSTNSSTAVTTFPPVKPVNKTIDLAYLQNCPDNASCSILGGDCISCKLNHYCVYGSEPTAECTVKPNITCVGEKTFSRQYHCRFAYQLDKSLYHCTALSPCVMKKAPPQTYYSGCLVRDDVLCLGKRGFFKKFPCNWTRGYKWSTALVLSVTLGGFGVDRFYLGLWREGIGKLFSFGGLGVWTLVDVILIGVGYVGPHDGSLYIYPWSVE